MSSGPAERPLSRRELRERERGRGAGDAQAPENAPGDAPAAAVDSPVGGRPDTEPTPARPAPVAAPHRPDTPTVGAAPGMPETVPSDTSRYRLVHYLVLALVACVLGYLIWSLTTGAADPGASSAGPAAPLTSPSALPAATQGEL